MCSFYSNLKGWQFGVLVWLGVHVLKNDSQHFVGRKVEQYIEDHLELMIITSHK